MHANIKESLHNLSDIEIAHRLAGGDTVALEVVMRRNNQTLYRAARSILKNDEDAEEAVQDTYFKAYRAIADYKGGSKLSTWLTRIAINEALARRRKFQHRANLIQFHQSALISEPAEGIQMQPISDSPESTVRRSEIRRLIERHIDQLPEIFRSVFVLRALEEMSVEETAICLGLPEATVRTRYFRGRALMRETVAREIDLSYEEAFSFDGERCDRIVENVLTRIATETQ